MPFPDAEATAVAHLNAALADAGDTARARTRVPAQRPARFVRVVLTGSQTRSVAHRDAQVTLECWDATSTGALQLAEFVYAAMSALDTDQAHVPPGPGGWLAGPAYLEDPTAGVPRYVMTAIVRLRAQ